MSPDLTWRDLAAAVRTGVTSAMRGRCSADVDDVTQAALIRLLRSLRAGRIPTNARGYAYATGRNMALAHVRADSNRVRLFALAMSDVDLTAPSHEGRCLDRAALRFLAGVLGRDVELFDADHLGGRERVRKMRARRKAEAAMGAAS